MDHPGFFEYRDELVWRNHSSRGRIVPTDERFGAGKQAAGQVYFRLIVEYKFFPNERFAQLIFQLEPGGNARIHARGVKLISVSARLGVSQGGLGILEQRLHIPPVYREDCDSSLGRDAQVGIAY